MFFQMVQQMEDQMLKHFMSGGRSFMSDGRSGVTTLGGARIKINLINSPDFIYIIYKKHSNP